MTDTTGDTQASLTPLPDPTVTDAHVDPWAEVERVDPPVQNLGPLPDSPDHAPFTTAGLHDPYRSWQDLMAGYQAEHDHQSILWKTGYCLWMVITMLHGPNTGIYDAATGLRMSLNLHQDGSTPPAGAVVWWSRPGSHGHIAVSAGQGYTWSTDILGNGRVWKVPISLIQARWGETYVGWTDNFCGQFNVSLPAPPAPPHPTPGPNRPTHAPVVSLGKMLAAQTAEQTSPRTVVHYPPAKNVEAALTHLGFNSGPVDGHLGTGFTMGCRAFQKSIGDTVLDGRLGPKQFALLAVKSGMYQAAA